MNHNLIKKKKIKRKMESCSHTKGLSSHISLFQIKLMLIYVTPLINL